jgi:cell division protein FtsQ
VVLTASVLVAWGLRRYLQSSPRFAVRTVEVGGNARRTAHQLAQRAGADVGKNIFAVDLQLARQAVEGDEWVERATVSRELPSTIRIDVTEREARALASLAGRLFLVDSKGKPFKALKGGDPSDLPVVTGLEPEQVARDREGVTERLRRVVDLLADLERVGIARRYPVQEVHLEPDDSAVVTIGSDAIQLQLGRPPYRAKIAQADRILLEVARRRAKPDVIFLDDDAHPERVVVRMR